MRILISGPDGLIGRALRRTLEPAGHEIVGLSRRARRPDDPTWSPAEGEIKGDLSGFDAVIHLAGESVAGGRWTAAKKKRIRSSRVQGTDLLARALAGAAQKPRVLLSASAIGFYGDRGDETLSEKSPGGTGFLAEVAGEWEAATRPAEDAGIRVAHMRIGLVLAPGGGALGVMLPVFRLGGGGRLGPGTQWMSWISIADVVGGIRHLIEHDEIRGPVNFTAPAPVTNSAFTRALARAVHRPALLPAPAFALRLALGSEKAEEMLLASTRVVPEVLASTGYAFQAPELTSALAALV